MTIIKRIALFAAVAATLAATTAQAQVDIYITGATAFRAGAYSAIRALYGANLASQNPADPASSANKVTWSGTIPSLFGGQTVTIRASYSGSVEGVRDVTQNNLVNFLATSTPGDATTVDHTADMTFSDVFQSTTAFKSPVLQPSGNASAVGVVPFVFFKSAATPAAVTSIGQAQAPAFFANGFNLLSTFTGNAADTSLIYLVGRDTGSGTRLCTELCTGVPAGAGKLYTTNGGGVCTFIQFPGYSSGSGIVNVFSNNACTGVGGQAAIGYASIPDAKNAVAGGAVVIGAEGELPYSGTITAPGNFDPVTKGLYNVWGYEHLYARNNTGNVQTYRNALKLAINTNLLTSITFIPLSAMGVERQADGGAIAPLE